MDYLTFLILLNIALPESEVRIESIWSLLQPYILLVCSGYKEEHAISSE
jgi:hypothetical protein